MNDSFYGITNYRNPTQTELMEYSAVEYLKWAFAKSGGFTTHRLNSPTNMDLLYMESSGVYRGRRSQWIYETGLSGLTDPIDISGVYVNGTLSTSGYNIDYNAGKVIFDSPAPASGSTIRVEYSHRTPAIYKIAEWFKQVQYDSSPYNPHFNNSASGIYSILNSNRVQLPAVIVHVPTEVKSTGTLDQPKGRGLGNITSYHKQDTLLYVLADNFSDCAKIHDILLNQKPSCFAGLNKKDILEDDVYPLEYNGYLNDSGLMYPSLIADYLWQRIDINNSRSAVISSMPNFHMSLVVWNTEILIN